MHNLFDNCAIPNQVSRPLSPQRPSLALREGLYEALEPSVRPLGISRRRFIELTALGAIGALLSACPGPVVQVIIQILETIQNRPVRRDINALPVNDQSLNNYRKAVGMMKALPAANKISWQAQARLHQDFCPHGNWLFLPWHREYLYRFEEICRQMVGDKKFGLPYWNWTKNPSVPADFFDTASPLYDATRNPDQTRTLSTGTVGATRIETILDQPNFLLFASSPITASAGQRTAAGYGPLESSPHNPVHPWVGGNMGSVANAGSIRCSGRITT